MPRFYPSIPFDDCYGSVGNRTYYHWKGIPYYKKKAYTEFQGTPAQLEQAAIHSRALEAWRSLEPSVQKTWNTFSVEAPSKRAPYDKRAHISGYNLFVSAYHGFVQLGNEHTPEPHRWVAFPDFFLDLESHRVVEDEDLQLNFFCSIGDGTCGHRYRLLLKLQLTKPEHGRRPGLQRNFLASANCPDEDGRVSFLIPGFREIWQLELPEYTAHCRFILIDTLTGFRSRHRMMSFRFIV